MERAGLLSLRSFRENLSRSLVRKRDDGGLIMGLGGDILSSSLVSLRGGGTIVFFVCVCGLV